MMVTIIKIGHLEEDREDENNHHEHDINSQGVHYEYRNLDAPLLGASTNEQVNS